MHLNRLIPSLAVLAIPVVGCASSVASSDEKATSVHQAIDACPDALLPAKNATQQYRTNYQLAEQNGFWNSGQCTVNGPDNPPSDGTGGMGVHFVNFQKAFAPLDGADPSILLYEPSDTDPNELMLAGVEWIQFIYCNGQPWVGGGDHDWSTPPPFDTENCFPNPQNVPQLFGQTFQGPMPGHIPGMPWHYDLHAYIYKKNPLGTFVPFNPNLSCGSWPSVPD